MFQGRVIQGDGIGRTLGYPTANIDVSKKEVLFSLGVYATMAMLEGTEYKGVLIIRDHPFKIEVYLFDYSGADFYGTQMTISPLQKISHIEKVASEEELKEKISQDIKLVKDYFAEKKK
ncbi:MAG: riboflavin kinase [bacterium]|nr:riboflavin kinase [bacterium]